MDYWAKDVYIWGIFPAEVYPRSSIEIQRTVRMSWISCPLNDLQMGQQVENPRTRGTVHNLNRKDTNRQSHSGRPKSSKTPHNVAAVRDSVVHSPSKSVLGVVTINTERYVQVLGKFWTALGRHRGVVRVLQWFQQDGATPTPQTNRWHGYSSVSLTDWSAADVTRSGRRVHRTWTQGCGSGYFVNRFRFHKYRFRFQQSLDSIRTWTLTEPGLYLIYKLADNHDYQNQQFSIYKGTLLLKMFA